MSTDPTRMYELLVGLPDVNVLAVNDSAGQPLEISVETRSARPVCATCTGPATVKDRPVVSLVDLPAFGPPTRLLWRKFRWQCLNRTCGTGGPGPSTLPRLGGLGWG